MPPEDPELPAPLVAILAAMSEDGRCELERALRLTLLPEPTALERRETELGSLARLLRSHGVVPLRAEGAAEALEGLGRRAGSRPGLCRPEALPMMTMERYDELKDADALSSRALVRRFGTWPMACRAANALPIDGVALSSGKPWPSAGFEPMESRQRLAMEGGEPDYTREDIAWALALCRKRLGRPPGSPLSSTAYIRWSAAQRRHARELGLPDPRLPHYDTIKRICGGWEAVSRLRR